VYFFSLKFSKKKFFERQVVFMKNMKVFVLSVVGVLLLCSIACAELPRGVIETPYFEISREYAKNPIKTYKEWVNQKGVALNGVVKGLTVTNGNAVVIFAKKDEGAKFEDVVYYFYFDGMPDSVLSLEEGRFVGIIGKVGNIRESKGALLIDVGSAGLM